MSDPKPLRRALDDVMARDYGRLLARWRRLSAQAAPSAAEVDALREAIAASAARRAARAARAPAIRVDESLPIAARADEIVALIRAHPVVVLAGETGSGKTTQLPKLCLAAGRGQAGLIGCTQPRRIAARAVARRVAAELGGEVGDLVGYQVRFAERVGENALVKFMTDGILLAETQSDPWLSAYDTIIVDEAHERSLNIDFLLGYLKRLLARRRDLKLIVTSATIDTARFAEHFGGAPVVEVEGRAYPVEVRWRPPDAQAARRDDAASPARRDLRDGDRSRAEPDVMAGAHAATDGRARAPQAPPSAARAASPARGASEVERIVAVVDEITAEDPRGDVLVFLPGEREIRDAHLALSRRRYRETEVLALYARLSAAEQDRVFRPGPQRRIVLATNVAETSLTVPRIRYVVDTGTARVKRYGQRNQLERLHVEPISQAAADQRKGRCGRVGPGVCYRLYGEDDYARRPRYTDPEILRSSLAGVILRMLSLKLGDPAEFPFVEAPSERAIADGYRRLAELGALEPSRSPPAADDQRAAVHGRTPRHALTEIGRVMARLPIDVALGRMLVEAVQRGTMRELLVLVAFLSIQDPRERPADARAQADAAHAPFADPKSDFAGILKLWSAYSTAHEELTQSKLRDWCQTHFLSFLRMREWRELHRQLRLVTDEPGWAGATAGAAVAAPAGAAAQAAEMTADVFEAIHRCLLSGWPTQVARKDERGQYRGTRERRFAIFPGSALAKSPPPWLLAGQILDLGGRVHALLCARIEPAWIEQQAAHLVRRTWRDAHWSRARGAVVAFEQVTLFGLTLVEKRAVTFGAQDPALAHAVFVREALARGEIDARADFVRANARVLAEAREIEAKRRRTGLLRDESELAAFFAGKLPADVHTAAALDAWYRRATPAEQAALHWSLADVLAESPGFGARDFPAKLDVGGHALRLAYRFVPGDPADGVTLHVPLAFVNAVSAARCEWLVPGLLADKVAEAIRGLPKPLRRNFVPAPDFARAFVEAEAPRDEPLFVALARYLQRVTGVEIRAEDFAGVELPPHLHMNFRVHDEQGATLAESRDLAAIQAQWTGAARTAFSRRAEIELTREHVEEFDFEDIPDAVVSPAGLTAFPALVDLGESVALRVFERRDEAQAEHRRGVERLLRRALADVVKRTRKQLPIKNDVLLKSAAMDGRFGAPAVRDDRKGPSQSAATAGRSGASAVKDDRKGPSQSAAMDGRFGPSAGRGERENSSRSVVADARGDSIRRAVDGRPGLAALAGGRAGSPSPLAALSALRDARRPIQPPPGVADALRDDLVEAALREQLARHDLDLRRRADFERVREAIARGLFPAAVERLALAEAILAAHAELRPLLEPPLIGFARANYDDLREQLGELLFPGFLRELDAARLAHYPRYLRAMRLRAERLRQDPARDQARMLAVQGYWREYLKRRAARGGDDAELSALRWLIEELRVSTFAQELGTTEPVSPKRIAKLIESLR